MAEVTVFENQRSNHIVFEGQHSDERVLAEVRPHQLAVNLALIKVSLGAVVVWLMALMVGRIEFLQAWPLATWGFILGAMIFGLGWMAVTYGVKKQVAYITDRRIIRFSAANPWALNTRSLTWDEAVKVKTFPPNIIWRWLNVGTVTVHAKSTIINLGEEAAISRSVITNDDVEMTDVWYYRDLGNYIDKILFMYKQKPKELEGLRPFVYKSKGKRD